MRGRDGSLDFYFWKDCCYNWEAHLQEVHNPPPIQHEWLRPLTSWHYRGCASTAAAQVLLLFAQGACIFEFQVRGGA